jgi:glycosyltransferase involved in cell wall biosynthesis
VRVLIDYRSALRERSGVGEYTHQLVRALLAGDGFACPDLTLFSSSWADRLVLPSDLDGAGAIDRRVPVRILNLAWHRMGWPAVETLTGRRFDVAHSMHPLLMPAREASRVVTIHDLYFLAHPEHARAEIRRDYRALAQRHAQRADRIIVISEFTARSVERQFGVPPDRISVCLPGAPDWPPRESPPADGGYVLFFGSLEPRKNVGGLLDAYERLLARRRDLPPLILAGRATAESRPWLERIARPPLEGIVRHVGYVDPARRRDLYRGACMLVQPSFDEGFGMPVLEAMTIGVPVIASNRGALPEVVGDAGPLVDPDAPEEIAAAIERMIDDHAYARASAANGMRRAALFNWARAARSAFDAYGRAIEHRRCGSA